MTATFLSFQVASRAMTASQANINVTGNNISNVNTEGYTRQRVDIVSVTTSGAVQQYANPQVSTGIGAEATGTTQIRDAYIDGRYRKQNSEASYYNTMKTSLTSVEDVFDEASKEALSGELSSFTDSLNKLSQTPTSSDIKQVIRSAAQKVTQYINMYANQIEDVRSQQVEDLNVDVSSNFNTYVKNIANLNDEIRKEEIYGNTPNELYDKRNLLIDKLSAVADIKVTNTPETISHDLTINRLSITLNNPTDSGSTPIKIVDNDKYGSLSYADTGDEVNLSVTDTAGVVQNDKNDYFSKGSIKGYLDVINGNGSFATGDESDKRGIPYYKEAMDIFAKKFASVFNNLNNVSTTGETPVALFTGSDGTSTDNITAATIQVSAAWADDPDGIKTTATTSTTTSGKPDNIVKMIKAMSDDQDFKYTPDGSTTESTFFSGNFNECITGTLGNLSTDVSLYENFSDTSDGVLATISTTRDDTSGVSLNEEGVNLTAYQKVYNAAIRYFNILDQNLDTIINTMGV